MHKHILSLAIVASIGLIASGASFAQATTTSSTTDQNGKTTTSSTSTSSNGMSGMDMDMGAKKTTTTTTTMHFSKPANALSEDAIKADIARAGYKEVKDLEFKDGVWQTKARGGNKQWEELRVAPVTGKVYAEDAPSKLTEDEVKAKLTAAGYTNIGHVKYDDGLWHADAETRGGKDNDLLVDPDDGSVVAKSDD